MEKLHLLLRGEVRLKNSFGILCLQYPVGFGGRTVAEHVTRGVKIRAVWGEVEGVVHERVIFYRQPAGGKQVIFLSAIGPDQVRAGEQAGAVHK